MEKIVLLDAEIAEKYHVRINYVQVTCENCGKSFGITPNENNEFDAKQLRCYRCAADELERVLASK